MQDHALESLSKKGGGIISGALLVAGTAIGAGMLALPTVTGLAGFIPAIAASAICWVFMLITGLLFLEATLWMKKGANILSMSTRFLGKKGRWIGGITFAFLYYCLLVSYIAGGAPLLIEFFHHYLGFSLPGLPGYVLFATLFGVIIYFGHKTVDRLNWILMIGLITSFILLILVGSSQVQPSLLKRQNWGLSLVGLPVLFSAYGYHNIVPSITFYMKQNEKKLRWAIIIGTAIPFIVYSIWQWMIIGSLLPIEIEMTAKQGVPITSALKELTGHQIISLLGNYLGFFALLTSFLGVSLSMVDFLNDGLKTPTEGFQRLGLCALVFLPPAFFAAAYPGIFIEALGVAGGFGEAILNGLFPILMVWVGRYHMHLHSKFRVPGGRLTLFLLLVFTVFIMVLEAQHLFFKKSF